MMRLINRGSCEKQKGRLNLKTNEKKIIITKDYLELAVELDAFTEAVKVSSRIFVDLF